MPTSEEMQALVPAAVLEVCETLRAGGFEAWVVGGAVRDLLLGKVPGDWDVASDCLPEKVLTLFKHTIATGLQHGTVTAVVGKGKQRENVEITTFRGEGAYSDGRRPDEVNFGVPLDEDLKRRDFVINAMAFDPVSGNVHDPFGGEEDLAAKRLRAVGVASERFNEDGLRVMRAVRFVSTLDFEMDPSTEAGLSTALDSLAKVAQERVRVELVKLLGGASPRVALEIAEKNGVLRVILPELNGDQSTRTFARVAMLKPDAVLRLAALLADVDAAALEPILRRLTMSNPDRQRILAALRLRANFATTSDDDIALRAHLSAVGRSAAADHLQVLAAEIDDSGSTKTQKKIERARQILKSGVPLEVGELAISGGLVMKHTGAKGPLIGEILRGLLAKVLEDPSLNNGEKLAELAMDLSAANPT